MIPSCVNNIFEFGYRGGGDCVAPHVMTAIQNNTPVFFPAGEPYLCKEPIIIRDRQSVRLYGEGAGSVLRADEALKSSSVFRVYNCSDVDISGLSFVGAGLHNAVSGDQSNAIVAVSVDGMNIEDCLFTRFSGNVVYCLSPNGLTVSNNKFWRNEVKVWDSGGIQSGDIVVSGGVHGRTDRDLLITGNRCLSNNRLGICLYQLVTSAIVTNNTVVSRTDDTMQEPSRPEDFRRKEGITLGYYCDNEHDESWDVICSNNIVRNTAWSGIYVAASSVSPPYQHQHDGINAVISSNLVSHCAMNVQAKNTPKLQAGLSLRGIRSANVTGNLIHSIDPLRTAPTSHQAAGIRVYPSVVATGDNHATINLTANTIRDVGGKGIELYGSDPGHVYQSGNAQWNCDL